MSGAEAFTVLGVISSIIQIVDATKQIYDTATNPRGLPEAFRDIAGRLPIVKNILSSAKQHIDQGDVDEDSSKATERVVKACEGKAKKLEELFHKAIPADGARDLTRYYKAVKAYGKGNEVESLMKGMLKDIQLLACEHGMKTVTQAQQEQIAQAITEVSAISPSVPEHIFQETGLTANNTSLGTQYIAQGEYIAQGSARQYNAPGGTMHFVQTNFHGTQNVSVLHRPETPPKPSSNIPFRRDHDFIPRQELLNELDQRCSIPAARIALVGLGGVGKSQLAIEFSYQVRDRSPESWVFWIHASNAARFEQSCREIADYAKIPGRREPKADIFKLVHDWLRDEKNGKWLLVMDNADDSRWLLDTHTTNMAVPANGTYNGSTRSLWEHLPQSQHGSVLITTRSKIVALKLVEERDIVPVKPMDEPHAVALLEKKLTREEKKEDNIKLVDELDFMPLAIVQAAAYINHRAQRCSVREYIEKFQKTDKSKTRLLTHEAGHLRRDRDAKNSIIITWQISFDYIQQERPSAANLLSLMSFFDRQGIPDGLLRSRVETRNTNTDLENPNGKNEDEDSGSEVSVTDEFEEDISMLRSYSFIVNIDKATFGMHRLVQLATRKWLKAHKQLERWKQQFIENLCAEFPRGIYENWAKCGALFPHVELALAQQPEGDDSLKEWALLLYNAASYALLRGNFSVAEKMSAISMKVREKQLGQDDNETLASRALISLTYQYQGRWNEAEELQLQVMETWKRVLGQEHPNTLPSMSNLALTYRNQGRWNEAEELQLQVMKMLKRVLGQEHPNTLVSMSNLACAYQNQGRWNEAEELQLQVIETMKRVLGQEHPNTLASIGNLARTHRNQGRWKEAEKLGVQVMETTKRVLGQEHLGTLTSISNLGCTYHNQRRWKEAEKLGVQVMETRKRVLGPGHPHTLASMGNLASTYQCQGRWKEAEELNVQVMETSKRVLGPEHPDTLVSISNLASTYHDQRRWKEAEELGVQVMETRKRVLGLEHPHTLTSMNNLAYIWKDQNRIAEALELMFSCLELMKRKLGANHPETIECVQTCSTWVMEYLIVAQV